MTVKSLRDQRPALINKSFKASVDVIRDLEKLAVLHGSNGRAIQVGTELLMGRAVRRLPTVGENPSAEVLGKTYSITPRTLRLIEQLLPKYKTRGSVLRAVVHVLQELD